MDITLSNTTWSGRFSWFWLFLLDLNDLLGRPFTLVLGENLVVRDWKLNVSKWNRNSTKYEFARILQSGIDSQTWAQEKLH